jgi:ComF family protein
MALINDLMSLIYPRACEACSINLYRHEYFICTQCRVNLPRSNYHRDPANELARTFAGRVPLTHACSFYTYEKKGRVQKLLHAIKYQDQKELGEFLGIQYGQQLKDDNVMLDVDVVIPIPLHKKKLKIRGYNQSEWFAKGIAAALSKTMDINGLTRVKETSTQTRKKKYERWENVEGIFNMHDQQRYQSKHVLLVDDVITTGATIEAAWMALKNVPGLTLSVASIAFASKGF